METSRIKKLKLARNHILIVSFIAFISFSGCNKENNDTLVLFDFEEGFDYSLVKSQDATYELINDNGNTLIKVTNGFTIREPGVKLVSSKENPWNLDGYYQIQADVSNTGDEFIQVELFVGNDPDGLVRWYCSDYVDLDPGESKTITIDLAWTPYVFDPQIEVNGMRGVPGKIKTNISKVQEMTFCSRYATQENQFTIDNVRAMGKLEIRDPAGFFPFIDEFGQFKHKDWMNKVHSEEEIKEMASMELEHLSKSDGPENIAKYGGWTAGPNLEATGFFRTEKVDGKWWMVDPEGYLFWTAGLNCVASDAVFTGITHREKYFDFLPEKDSKLAQFYGEGTFASHGFYKDKLPYDTYNFYQSNLYRKYGDDWLQKFQEMAHLRIKDWGMNTIGFVSDFGVTRQHKTPYVGSVWIHNEQKIEGSEGFWGKFHDVFDPKFREAVRTSMESQKEGAGDPWCIGYFVDNELSWGQLGSLAAGTLRSPATQSAKIEFVNDLKSKYQQIENLNQKWKTNHDSWESLLTTTETPDEKLAKEDMITFYRKIAETYFRIINEELKRIAPSQNYLGCRFAWANNDVVLTAASKYLDVMSFNKYEYSVESLSLPEGLDKPVMIGEFHFGALDRGSFHVGVKKANSQSERGQFYQNYVQGALRNPLIVGAHWFQYLDEPNTGRFDGENYNVGFVDICDNPYEELIEKVKETTYSMYEYRRNN
ncbi:MAG: beta-galactosidase [Maribacter sp.]